MEVVILGTSSAAPTVRRGLSGTALIRDGETLLFDCGEGTQFQMLKRSIPRRKFHRILISHLHGDHVFGLGGLISSMNLSQREYPLHVYGPRGIKRFLDFMTSFPRPTRLGFTVHVHELAPGFRGVVCRADEYRILAAPLDHSIPAFGFRFQEEDLPGSFDEEKAEAIGIPFGPERGQLIRGESITLADGRTVQPEEVVGPPRPGKSVALCLDTAFSPEAQKLARGADLLIHEATYGDDLQEMAAARKHSTIRQAATVAREAGVKQFIATNFSTRYDGPAMESLVAQGREVFPEMIAARDGTRVQV